MAAFVNSDPNLVPAFRRRPAGRRGAFSLVEIALALGIVAFALVPVVGLLPIGLSSFKKGMDLSVSAQITQRIIDEAQQSDFEKLVGQNARSFAEPVRFFSAQGEEQTAGQAGIIYRVNTVVNPLTLMPGASATGGGVSNPNIATVTVQVANNPANYAMTPGNDSPLWVPTGAVTVTTSSTYVARNSALPAK